MALATRGISHPDDPGEPHPDNRAIPRVSVSEQDAALLAQLARDRTVCEIGTGLGVSTRAFASTAFSVLTVDIDPWVHQTVWPLLPPIVKTARSRPNGVYDMVFIDGAHQQEPVEDDFKWAMAHGDLIVAHDFRETRQWLEAFGEWVMVDTTYGIGIWLG